MDVLLGKLTSQAMNYAIRSGITITTTYAINQCTHLLKQTPHTDKHRQELLRLQLRLESKIRILSPAIDMIELIASRGNTTLESAVGLTKAIRFDIQRLGAKIAGAVERQSRKGHDDELIAVIEAIKALLLKIEDAIPLINLAITTSGVNLSTKLSGTISPSRLLQASTFLTAADAKYTACVAQTGGARRQQVGPTWMLSLYMLFAGHADRAVDEGGVRTTTWKEVLHKAKVKLIRVPLEDLYALSDEEQARRTTNLMEGEEVGAEFAYQLVVIEDLDDDRVHSFDDEASRLGRFEDVAAAGIRDVVPIHEISKIFYADTGKILDIGSDDDDVNNPVLLIKRDIHAEPPRRMLHRSQMSMCGYHDDSEMTENGEQSEIDAQLHRESTPAQDTQPSPASERSKWRLPPNLDPEWMAFEVYTAEDLESPTSSASQTPLPSRPTSSDNKTKEDSLGPDLTSALSSLQLKSPSPLPPSSTMPTTSFSSHLPRIRTSLSLLEMLVKLTALQQFRQDSHLAIEDEVLNFFLEDSATAGAGADKGLRRKMRNEAVRRVGFDPYDESPVKRRGEEYIASARGRVDGNVLYNTYADVDEHSLSSPPQEFAVRPSIEMACPDCGSSASPSPRPGGREGWSPAGTPLPLRLQPPAKLSRKTGREENALPKAVSQSSLPATPPNTLKYRKAEWRAQSAPVASSLLGRQMNAGSPGEKSLMEDGGEQ